ncbi:unnamed protein product [Pieris macdunnoughi]|uniref:Uncharacterized protein n=1 Tax=Pieris macdunnoughi TaxID=345717 RepID=A0A821RFV4_9NEOP|nr:unnamed protein product [Pieris macdunnoughi]
MGSPAVLDGITPEKVDMIIGQAIFGKRSSFIYYWYGHGYYAARWICGFYAPKCAMYVCCSKSTDPTQRPCCCMVGKRGNSRPSWTAAFVKSMKYSDPRESLLISYGSFTMRWQVTGL